MVTDRIEEHGVTNARLEARTVVEEKTPRVCWNVVRIEATEAHLCTIDRLTVNQQNVCNCDALLHYYNKTLE